MKTNSLEIPQINFDENGELKIIASESSSKDDFDFFSGKIQHSEQKIKNEICQFKRMD